MAASEALLLAMVPDVGEKLVLVARKPAVAYAPAPVDRLAPRVLTPESAT